MMVPIREMTDVMRVVKEVVSVKPKQWVRLKRGIYKDDLAQVQELAGSNINNALLTKHGVKMAGPSDASFYVSLK